MGQEQSDEWYYEDGLTDYLTQATQGWPVLPEQPFVGSMQGNDEAVEWAVFSGCRRRRSASPRAM
jgi:topoisomerase-4 subunit B